jgi:lipoprotein-anchoring transpeptidase ErfK/SrfK
MKNIAQFAFALVTILSTLPTFAQETGEQAPPERLTSQQINEAEFSEHLPEGLSAITTKLQILLDRAGSNPGVIDGVSGDNVTKAVQGYEQMLGLEPTSILTPELWAKLQSPEPVTIEYVIEAADVEKLVEAIPDDYAEKAKMQWLGYTSGHEAIAEKFHMDKDFLATLNPGATFSAGETVLVANPGVATKTVVTRIVADKANKRVIVYGADNKPEIIYPATIGSDATPSPVGTHEVRAVAEFPTYGYNPDVNFQQGENSEKLTIPPGPNGPVGSTWIDLTEPTYGIHGTPEPAQISKTSSHGCIRLTNWDAAELAKLVKPGVKVTFVEATTSLY